MWVPGQLELKMQPLDENAFQRPSSHRLSIKPDILQAHISKWETFMSIPLEAIRQTFQDEEVKGKRTQWMALCFP